MLQVLNIEKNVTSQFYDVYQKQKALSIARDEYNNQKQNYEIIKNKVEAGLKEAGNKKVLIPTVFTAAPAVIKEFDKTPYAARLKECGVIVSYLCPLMYMNNPLCGKMPVITSSNKLRTYTTARYYTDDEILKQITKGGN